MTIILCIAESPGYKCDKYHVTNEQSRHVHIWTVNIFMPVSEIQYQVHKAHWFPGH